MTEQTKDKFYGWTALGATAVVCALSSGGASKSFGVFAPSIIREFQWSSRDVSFAFMLLMAVMSLTAPLTGMLVEKFGARKCLSVGNLIGAGGLLLLAFHHHLWELYLGAGLLVGFGNASLGGLLPMTTVANNWFRKKVPLAMAIIVATGGFGGLIIAPILMYLINTIGWRTSYIILSGLVVLLAVIVPAIFIRNKPEDMGQVPDGEVSSIPTTAEGSKPRVVQYVTPVDFTVKEAMKTPAFWYLAVAVTVTFFLLTMIMAHQVAFLQQAGIGSQWASIGLGLISAGIAIGNLFMGILTVRFTLKRVATMGFAVAFLGMLVGIVTNVVTHNVVLACIYSLLVGLGEGSSLVAGISVLSAYFGRAHYPKLMGVVMVFGILGNLSAPIVGAIHDATKSYTAAWGLGAVATAIGVLTFILIKPPVHPSLRKAQNGFDMGQAATRPV